MKIIFLSIVFLFFAVLNIASANEASSGIDVLAKRGNGIVTQRAFTARVTRIPEEYRLGTIRDKSRLRDLINNMLLNAQLAADAREVGFDATTAIMERMKLAAERELSQAWLQHYVNSMPDADYEAMAYEYYQLNSQEFLSTLSVDVTHILVSISERQPEGALALANSIHQQLLRNPSKFDELVAIHSEDPSVAQNSGRFSQVKKGDMVKSFEEAAFALAEGEISTPVETSYGYHIIRLDARNEPKVLTFDEVKEKLVEKERERHAARNQRNYLSGLTALEVQITEEALEEMVSRQFPEDYIDIGTVDGGSE